MGGHFLGIGLLGVNYVDWEQISSLLMLNRS
jgi:hypothetical protein